MAEAGLTGVSKHRGAARARRVRHREVCVFVGPSGGGRSALLRSFAALEVSGGTIAIGGRDATWLAPCDRDVAMVVRSCALHPRMTVRENMDFGMKVSSFAPGGRIRRIADAARVPRPEQVGPRRAGQGRVRARITLRETPGGDACPGVTPDGGTAMADRTEGDTRPDHGDPVGLDLPAHRQPHFDTPGRVPGPGSLASEPSA